MSLGLGLQLQISLGLQCTVCKQMYNAEEARDTAVMVALFGKSKYAVCVGCGQEPPDSKDRGYRKRTLEKIHGGETCTWRGRPSKRRNGDGPGLGAAIIYECIICGRPWRDPR